MAIREAHTSVLRLRSALDDLAERIAAFEQAAQRAAAEAEDVVATKRIVSLQPALRRIAEFADLPANWDSYGAVPPAARAIAEACVLVEAVAEAQERTTGERHPPWTTAPIADGGIQIEWAGHDARIEVQVAPDGVLGYLVQRGTEAAAEYDEADDVPFNTVLDRIAEVLGS